MADPPPAPDAPRGPHARRPSRAVARRRRAVALVALSAVVVVAVLAVAAVRDALRGYDPGDATVEHVEVRSAVLDRTLPMTLVSPAGGARGRPLLVLLHGRGGDGHDSNLSDELFAALELLGPRAPAIAFPNGGEASYWHDRGDGGWAEYVLQEAIPAAERALGTDRQRVAIGGVSMGGFGAYALARRDPGRFCAVGGHSAALWEQAGDSAAGAFDDAEDFARNDLLAIARSDAASWGRRPLWLDVGAEDPFRAANERFAATLRAGGADVALQVWPGAHEGDYWRAHMGRYLRFYAGALADC